MVSGCGKQGRRIEKKQCGRCAGLFKKNASLLKLPVLFDLFISPAAHCATSQGMTLSLSLFISPTAHCATSQGMTCHFVPAPCPTLVLQNCKLHEDKDLYLFLSDGAQDSSIVLGTW